MPRCVLRGLAGTASGDAAIGDLPVLVTTGVWALPAVSTDHLALVDAVCFRTSGGAVTGTARIGVAVSAAGR